MEKERAPTEDDSPTYKISGCLHANLDDEGWPQPYVTPLHLYIWQEWWDDDQQDVLQREAGTLEGYIFRAGLAMNDGVCVVQAADDESNEAQEYCSAVIQAGKNTWKKSIARQFGYELFESDLLALTSMKIKEEHRGDNLGLRALLGAMQLFSTGCGLTLLKPWPLQYTSKEFSQIAKTGVTEQGWTERRRKEDFTKLRNYWARLGFSRLGKSDFYAFPGFMPLPQMSAFVPSYEESLDEK